MSIKEMGEITMRRYGRQQGQSLVEMAILFPLLIFIFIGLVEVGWAIRGYLTTVSLTRETVRFAARSDTLDFGQEGDPGWWIVAQHYRDVAQDQSYGLKLVGTESEVNGALWLSYYKIDTGYPCDPDVGCLKSCDGYNPIEWDISDDNILTPSNVLTYSWRIGLDRPSPLDRAALTRQLIQENNVLNCQRWQLDPEHFQPKVNEVIVSEILFYQPQLLGFPVLDWVLDPVPLYAQTTMRRNEGRHR